jgi:hypothetical protein
LATRGHRHYSSTRRKRAIRCTSGPRIDRSHQGSGPAPRRAQRWQRVRTNWDSTSALSNEKKFGDPIVKKIPNANATRTPTSSLRCRPMNRRIPDSGIRWLVSCGARVFELISWIPRCSRSCRSSGVQEFRSCGTSATCRSRLSLIHSVTPQTLATPELLF